MYSPKLYFRDPWIFAPIIVSILLQVFCWWYLLNNIKYTTDQVFLHYNIISGVDLIGDWRSIFTPLIVELVAFLANFSFSFFVYGRDRLLSRFLSIFTALFGIFMFIGIWLIAGLDL